MLDGSLSLSLTWDNPTDGETSEIPPAIRNFLTFFQANIMEQNLPEIQACYDSSWNKLSERFYKEEPWPSPEKVAPLVDNDKVFLILYNELSFRHIYANLGQKMTLEQRFASFENYVHLFNHILNAESPVQLELPNQWLWDIIDEFIYQFQAFCQYRAKLSKKSKEEVQKLKTNPQIWNIHSVLNVLHSLIDKSKIQEQLVAANKGGDVA